MPTRTRTYMDVFKDAVLAVNSTEHLDWVRAHSTGILLELERLEEDPFAGSLSEVDPGWLAAIYEALSHEDEFLGEDRARLERLFEAKQTEEQQIGAAFHQALLVNLPEDLRLWRRIEPSRAAVPEQQRAILLQSLSAQGSPYAAEHLVPFGMTPLTIFQATDAIGGLVERLVRKRRLDHKLPVALSPSGNDFTGLQRLDFPTTASEVGLVTGLAEPNSVALTNWCIQAAQCKPSLFPWVSSKPLGRDGVHMTWVGEAADNLFERWGLGVTIDAAVARIG